MAALYDLVIRGGMIADGSDRPVFKGDVAIKDGVIAAVGKVDGTGKEELNAAGRLLTPGFVDIHTHYDGHVTWANRLAPSSHHGVTTIVMGNCGVGFAPCKPEDRTRLVHLMEGVEDIPEVVMTAGLPWNWRTFPEYLDRLSEREYDMDVAAQIPHAPLRVFVMGERAAARDPATPDDIVKMRDLVREAIEAGALGFSSSRSLNHKATDGTLTPTYGAAADELGGIASGLKQANKGVLQIISDFDDVDAEFAIIRRMMTDSGRPLATTVLQIHHTPERWRQVMDRVEQVNKDGMTMRGQICARPVGVMLGLDMARHPFRHAPSYKEIAHLPLPERLKALRDPARRARILAEGVPDTLDWAERLFATTFTAMYDFDETGYEPTTDQSVAARAKAAGVDPAAYTYDMMTRGDGTTVIYMPSANYHGNDLHMIETMLTHENTVLGLGDGGAHLGLICDASLPTYMLQRWPDSKGGTLPVERVVKALTSETANSVGLHDRGILAPGYRADVNIIDMDKIKVGRPEMAATLPSGAKGLSQSATGYDATIVRGVVTYRNGAATGALPGRLVRGAQRAPQAAKMAS
jgi:N-acyl-D-aspartate/D-glutamate deacylase